MRVAALTCRSYYSLLRGSVSVQRLVQKAKEYGYGAIALADVNSMYGAVDFYKEAEQVNIKPIIGVEILTDTQRAILLAEDRAGYRNLCRITTARNLDINFDLIQHLESTTKVLSTSVLSKYSQNSCEKSFIKTICSQVLKFRLKLSGRRRIK